MMINFDEVVTGALVNAMALAGRRISVAVDGLRGRRRVSDLTAARWFETYRMTSEAPGLPELPAELTERLAEVMRGDEAQAGLHELLGRPADRRSRDRCDRGAAGTEPDLDQR